MQVGEQIPFGQHDWVVLSVQKHRALLITRHIIQQRSYHDAYTEITWADCALRKYLCGEFYDSFGAADRARICVAISTARRHAKLYASCVGFLWFPI